MNAFAWQRPGTVAQAAALLPSDVDDRSAALMAGGQDLLTELRNHLVEPERVVSLKGVAGLDALRFESDGSLVIGALVTLERLAADAQVRARLAVLAEAALSVGSPQIRAAGTVGGNLNQRPRCWYYRNEAMVCLKKGGDECFAQSGMNKYNAILGGGPSYIVHPSDLAPALVALSAEATLVSPRGARTLKLEDFYKLPSEVGPQRETVRAGDEVMTEVRVPAPAPGMRSTYAKFKERGSYDWALSAVALCLWTSGGAIADARLVLGGVAPKPWRTPSTEALLKGRVVDDETCRLAGVEALRGAAPLADNGYKIPLTQGLLTRALRSLS
ncbi:MAG: xanthine dehydrogenase family protein subunit M [Planctomycetes bacterium]|nr:xanthine dehydrogenase family protein subunit M [Planctomycetota bacterium]